MTGAGPPVSPSEPTRPLPVAPADAAESRLARVAALLPAGEARPQQAGMCRAVASAIATGRHLVVQAGTGTGKSLAYLAAAVESRRPVVVATATKALQDQLAKKDLPALAQALERPLSFAVLKGRSNYLCLAKAAEVDSRATLPDIGAADTDPVVDGWVDADGEGPAAPGPDRIDGGRLGDHVRAVLEWAATSDTGDRGDLPFEPHPRAWAMLSVGPRECPGAARCPEGGRCFAERARMRAAEADVVVVNTHLYGAHLASGGAVLPPHDVVVFDEAHEVDEVMTASLGVDVTPGRLAALHSVARTLVGPEDAASVDLAGVAERLRCALAERTGLRVPDEGPGPVGTPADPRSHGRAPEPEGRERSFFCPPGPSTTTFAAPRSAGVGEVSRVLALASARVDRLRAVLGRGTPPDRPDAAGDIARRARASAAAANLAEDLRRLGAPGPDEVVWVDGTPRQPVLRLSPIDVGPALGSALWGSVTAVLTSATVPPRLTEQLGMEGFDLDRLDVGSPFDYRANALLYVARHLPDPRRPDAEAAVHDELAALIGAAGGRTLALFTSRRATAAAAVALRDRLSYRVLVQGDMPKGRLLEAFACDEASCLFATIGFWQGVDVPGRTLSLVTLDRLPFGRPDDPLLGARRERAGDAAFHLVDLPRAATLLAQGAGRLIRTATDRGVVAVLDPRLATARYRGVLLDAMPPMRRTVRREEAVGFLARVLAGDQ